jgi:hypothetical protein
MEVDRAKCRVARAVKDRNKTAELEGRQDLAEALIAKRITTILADAPALRAEQRARLAALIRVT